MSQFTLEEIKYIISELNGVMPTIDLKQETETVRTNILASHEFNPLPMGLPQKLRELNYWEVIELYAKTKRFWLEEGTPEEKIKCIFGV